MVQPIAIEELVRLAGGQGALAEKIGCTQGNVSQLLKRRSPLPARFVLAAEKALDIRRERIRPDLYADDGVSPALEEIPAGPDVAPSADMTEEPAPGLSPGQEGDAGKAVVEAEAPKPEDGRPPAKTAPVPGGAVTPHNPVPHRPLASGPPSAAGGENPEGAPEWAVGEATGGLADADADERVVICAVCDAAATPSCGNRGCPHAKRGRR